MKKLSNPSKRLILWIFAVLIVYAFLATSISPLTGYSETHTNTKPIFDAVNLTEDERVNMRFAFIPVITPP